MNEQTHYYRCFNAEVQKREPCDGENCRGWHLSQVDTWHECPCNYTRQAPHPEAEPD